MRISRTIISSLLLTGLLFAVPVTMLDAQEAPPPSDPTTRTTTEPQTTTLETDQPARKGIMERIPIFSVAGTRLLNYLTNLRTSIERSKGITDTERQGILATLNKDISYIQTEVITASRARTETELNQRITRVRSFWQQKQNTVTYYLGLVTGGKFRRTIERFRSIETKFTTLFARFEPTPELIALKGQFSTELNAAEENSTKARDLFAKIQSPGDHTAEFQEGLMAFRQAHLHLKEARRISREILAQLRDLLGVAAEEPTSTPSVQP